MQVKKNWAPWLTITPKKYEQLFDSVIKELGQVITANDRLAYLFIGEKFAAIYKEAIQVMTQGPGCDFDPDEFRGLSVER
jgi:hypothetical protein